MKKRLLMPLNLQYFAEAGSTGDGGQETPPAGNNNDQTSQSETDTAEGQEKGKAFTRDEVAKMIAAETNKAKEAWVKEQKERQAKAERQAKMTAEEKIKEELEEKDQKIAELERKQTLATMTKEASKMLSEAELPHDDDLLELIVKDDEEATMNAIAVISSFASKLIKENARQATPNDAASFSVDKNELKDIADIANKARIIEN